MEVGDSPQSFGDTEHRLRLILIGKTGAGKSATGNTILGQEVFKAQVGLNSTTKECGFKMGERNGQKLMVMDTPGLCDTDGEDKEIATRITQSLLAVAPGPHAVILVLRCDQRFNEEEAKVFKMLKDIFGRKMTSYLIVLLAGKDRLDKAKVKFEDQLPKAKLLQGVLQEAGNRYLLFSNEGDEQEKAQMVDKLIQMVKEVVTENDGGCFRHRISQMLDETLAKMVTEEIRKRTGEILPVPSEGTEHGKPKPTPPKPPKPAKQTSSEGTAKPPAEERKEAAEDVVAHADQQAINRRQEMRDLQMRGTVKFRLRQLSSEELEPETLEVEYRHRTPVHTPRNSAEIKKRRRGFSGDFQTLTSQTTPEEAPPTNLQDTQTIVPEEPAFEESVTKESVPKETALDECDLEECAQDKTSREVTVLGKATPEETGLEESLPEEPDPEESTQEESDLEEPAPEEALPEDPAHSDVVCHWKSGDVHVEEVLDQLQDQLIRELRTTDDAAFVYAVPVKPATSLVEKECLVEDALKMKIVSHPEALDEAQKQAMENAVSTVKHKLKEGMAKFAVKAIDQCLLM